VKASTLWPREHGAYAQLAFPLITALAHGRWTFSSIALAIGAIAVFLAHEPALILLGHRGPRVKAALQGPAIKRLGLLCLVALLAGVSGLATAPVSLTLPIVVALVLGVATGALVVRKEEKTLPGECIAATTMSFAVFPVAVAGLVPMLEAAALSAVWALVFVMSTCAVQVVIGSTKRKRLGSLAGRSAIFLLAVVVPAAAFSLFQAGRLPGGLVLALVPVSLLSAVLSVRPPHARWLRQIGWGIVATCTTSLVILVVA
jgi:hypothetical protein